MRMGQITGVQGGKTVERSCLRQVEGKDPHLRMSSGLHACALASTLPYSHI